MKGLIHEFPIYPNVFTSSGITMVKLEVACLDKVLRVWVIMIASIICVGMIFPTLPIQAYTSLIYEGSLIVWI